MAARAFSCRHLPPSSPSRWWTTTSAPRLPTTTAGLKTEKVLRPRDFIAAQNAYTARYMKQARIRPQILDDLDDLEHVSRWSLPIERGGNYYFEKRLAGEEQASIYIRRGWTGKDERLVDPAALSRDPTYR